MKVDFDPVIDARLSIQRALLGEITPELRAIVFSVDTQILDVRFYFNGPLTEEVRESVSCVETEILADYDPEVMVSVHCIQLDYPAQIDDSGVWVYQRRE